MASGSGEAFWRERAEQLQHALVSRVVIEQAKGVLAERLGVNVETSFEVLRYAARSTRTKLQDLAHRVVESDGTPEEIIEALARHTSILTASPRAARVVQTESFFRAVNDEIAKLDGASTAEFVCECGNPVCTETISLNRDALRTLHSKANRFIVIAGHEIPDVEVVVERTNGYLIVEKTSPGSD